MVDSLEWRGRGEQPGGGRRGRRKIRRNWKYSIVNILLKLIN